MTIKRSYSSPKRAKAALKTKHKILKSALSLFSKEGFYKVSIERIALAAKVSTPTIYATFKSKQGILEALTEEALPQETFDSLVTKSYNEKDPKKRLQISAKIARSIYDAEKKQIALLSSSGLISPHLKKIEEKREMRRYQRQALTIKAMKEEGSLKKTLSEKKARDILWTLTGRDLYKMLVSQQKWSSNSYEQFIGESLIQALINETLNNFTLKKYSV